MAKKLFVPILLGTVREGRKSEAAAKYIHKVVSRNSEIESEVVDPRKLNLPGDGNGEDAKDPEFTKITKRADAFIVVCPEYNHSFPGSLKRMLDSESKNYIHKPVVIVGVSSGPWGGVRAIQSLIPVLRELGMVVTFSDIMITDSGDAFDEKGEPKRKTLEGKIDSSLEELLWHAKSLNWAKQNLPNKYHEDS